MEGISYIEKNGTPAIKADGSLYEIPFYKENTITVFKIPTQGRIDGSFYCEREFKTKKSAINFMIKISKTLSQDNNILKKMRKEIKEKCTLTYNDTVLKLIRVNE